MTQHQYYLTVTSRRGREGVPVQIVGRGWRTLRVRLLRDIGLPDAEPGRAGDERVVERSAVRKMAVRS